MIDAVDSNKNHTIEFDEFYKVASQASQHNLGTISEYWYQYSTKPIIREAGMHFISHNQSTLFIPISFCGLSFIKWLNEININK